MEHRARIEERVSRYLSCLGNDMEGWLSLFAEDAVVEDPVGSKPLVGREAIRKLYERNIGSLDSFTASCLGGIKVAANQAAFRFHARSSSRGRTYEIEIIDTVRFSDSYLIEEIRAYWSSDDFLLVG